MADKHFINDDFLLSSDTACQLYHDYAAEMPIIDYHCHLPPEEIAEDKHWETMTELWLGGDHYKWRAMRSNGIKEEIISRYHVFLKEGGELIFYRPTFSTIKYNKYCFV